MQQSDFDHVELSPTSCLDQLDAALYRLEMLATGTELRRQYLKEKRNKNIANNSNNNNNNNKLSNMIRINTNYVSTVSIDLRQIAPFTTTKAAIRYKPYTIKERLRTRSENNDNGGEIVDNQKLQQPQQQKQHDNDGDDDLITELKKAKSLESILAENSQQSDQIDLNNIKIDCNQILTTTTDMEIVSNSIQNLKVNE